MTSLPGSASRTVGVQDRGRDHAVASVTWPWRTPAGSGVRAA